MMAGVACAEQELKRTTVSQIHFLMSEVYQQLSLQKSQSRRDVRIIEL